jgi:hypothetical protein
MKKKALLCGLVLTGLISGAAPSEAQSPVVVNSPAATGSATSAATPLPESDLKTELRDLHEDLRRIEGALHDLDREAGRRQVIANSLSNNDAFIADPWMGCMACGLPSMMADSTRLGAFLKPRASFLNLSLSTLDLQSTAVHSLVARLGGYPEISSNVKAKVDLDVLSDALKDFDGKLVALKALCNVEALNNAQILMAVGTLKDSVKGIDTVGGRLWKAEKK